LKFCYISFE
jgi:Ran GTPase-activating protein (RanGAP) involved in mRNA processing and transport